MKNVSKILIIIMMTTMATPYLTASYQQPFGAQAPVNYMPPMPATIGQQAPMYAPTAGMPPAAGPSAAAPAMSDEDMQFLQELDSMIQNLSPEEKQQLDDMSKRMGDRIDEMFAQDPSLQQRIQDDPSALESFLNTVITPEIEQIESAAIPAPEEPIEEAKPAPEEPKKERIDYTDEIAILDSIIDSIDEFEVRTGRLDRFTEQYEKWVKQGRIQRTEEAKTWKQAKEKLDKFKQTVHQLKQEEDPEAKIKTYRHIESLIAEKQLWKDLTSVANKLEDSIPKIKTETKGAPMLTSQGKDAARNTLNTLLEGISLQPKLEEIIKKYEKRAGELRDVEKKHQEKALAESKKQRPARPTTVVGRGEREEYPGYIPEEDYGRGGMYPWEQGPSGEPWKPEPAEKGAKPSESKDGKAKPAKPAAKDKSKMSDEEKRLSDAVDGLMQPLREIAYKIEDNAQLQNFESYMSSVETGDNKKRTADIAADLKEIGDLFGQSVNQAKKAVNSAIRNVNEGTKKEYLKEINDELSSKELAPIRALTASIEAITKNPSKVRDTKKQYIFMGQQRESLKNEEEKVKEEIQQNNSEIQQNYDKKINDLNRQIQQAEEQGHDSQPFKVQRDQQKKPVLKIIPESKFKDVEPSSVSIEEIPAQYNELLEAIKKLETVKQRPSARKKEMTRARSARAPEESAPEKAE